MIEYINHKGSQIGKAYCLLVNDNLNNLATG